MIENREWYKALQAELCQEVAVHKDGLATADTLLLIRVELALRLLEVLGLDNQPAGVVWVLLSGQRLPKLGQMGAEQRRALANARQYIQFGRYAWDDAIKWYMTLPAAWRQYAVDPAEPVRREPNGPTRVTGRDAYYDRYLREQLRLRRATLRYAPEGTARFPVGERRLVHVVLDPELVAAAAQVAVPRLPDIQTPVAPRPPVRVSFAALTAWAEEVDQRESELGLPPGHWADRMRRVIRYRRLRPDGTLDAPNDGELEISGLCHVAGMVGAGKTALMTLLASYGAVRGGWRTGLVVDDTHTALRLADYFNRLLVTEGGPPVAVPLLGRTTRHRHLAQLTRADAYESHHWGLRWLDTVCLLQGLVDPLELVDKPLRAGAEPCQGLLVERKDGKTETRECPLFSLCPSRQLYRDIPAAQIWITTPGALTYSHLPAAADDRRLSFAAMFYHYADLVVLDEVDTAQAWMDDTFAPDLWLLDAKGGIMGELGAREANWVGLTGSRDRTRWYSAWHASQMTTHLVCSMLEEHDALFDWVRGYGYFTARALLTSLAEDMAVFWGELAGKEETSPEVAALNEELWGLLERFHEENKNNPAYPDRDDLVFRLHQLLGTIERGGSMVGELARTWAEEWVRDVLWGDEEPPRMGAAEAGRLRDLAQRLEFAVGTAGLDYDLRVTFGIGYGMYALDEELPYGRIQYAPPEFLRVLPEAPTGLSFGLRYTKDTQSQLRDVPGEERVPRHLVVFQYRANGRVLLLRFHNLLDDLGYPGPHVLAMSGTSWLPDSDMNHFAAPPVAVLETGEREQEAIAQSRLMFWPQRDNKNHPIAVSGTGKLEQQLMRLARSLACEPSMHECPLRLVMDQLEGLGKSSPALWADRQRMLLLVNSYAQARLVANEIAVLQPEWQDQVFYLAQGAGEGDRWTPSQSATPAAVQRADVEQFGQLRARVLVAPMQAIGRRYNILNEAAVAAFGAIWFLTRPMPQPDDMSQWVRWVNYQAVKLYDRPEDPLWQDPSLLAQGLALRRKMHGEWWKLDNLRGWSGMNDDLRHSLAATTIGKIVQACGRLLRGGMPFLAYFVDAQWAPATAAGKQDTPTTSLLAAMLERLDHYCQEPVGRVLYSALNTAFHGIQGLRLKPTVGRPAEEQVPAAGAEDNVSGGES